jgi:hypothetical protein
MWRTVAKITAAAVVLAFAIAASAATVPAVRHIATGLWNTPEGLAALPENPLVHYEPGAAGYAQDAAALLPAAVAQIESAQGRPFARPVTIGVYASREAFAAANGLGNSRAAGVTFFGRILLSPILFTTQRQRLAAILTHEMSHAHLQSWIPVLAYIRLPNWFKEGLAVMVSGGGGAERVSEAEARDAIRRGERIAAETEGALFNLAAINFENPPPETSDPGARPLMAYRQAGLFVTFMHDSNPAGFARMMAAVLDGRPFAEAVTAGYGKSLDALWSDFLRANDNLKG